MQANTVFCPSAIAIRTFEQQYPLIFSFTKFPVSLLDLLFKDDQAILVVVLF